MPSFGPVSSLPLSAAPFGSLFPTPTKIMKPVIGFAPSEAHEFEVLRSFLLAICDDGTEVLKAQVNRVAEPRGADFIMLSPIGPRLRIETNDDEDTDAVFTASIDAGILTVMSVDYGELLVGNAVWCPVFADYPFAIFITEAITGVGGVGTYQLNADDVFASSQKFASGSSTKTQPMQVTIQLDVHGPNSAKNATLISTLFRDSFGTEFFAAQDANITPLFADDPREMPFLNDQQQYEYRWVIEVQMQVNATVTISAQQFADTLTLQGGFIDVETTYPPS